MSVRTGVFSSAFFVVAALPLFASHAQESARRLYVVRAVGDWVLFDSGKPLPLRALDPVLASSLVGIRPGAPVDTGHSLVLRDPRSLRTATWNCNPVGRCQLAQRVSRLSFSGSALPSSKRTGALFVHLGENRDERSRVKLVGARGAEPDWGLMVLSVYSDTIARESLITRAGQQSGQRVARLCPLQDQATRDACETALGIGQYDCDLNGKAQCSLPDGLRKQTPISIQISSRAGSRLALDPMARAFGVVSSQRNKRCLTQSTDAYARDLKALEASVSQEEFRALEAAAATEIARGCR